MKKTLLTLITGMTLAMSAQATSDEKLIEAMLFIVAPINEDPKEYKAAISVCNCALSKAQASWDAKTYEKFTNDVLAHARNVQATIKSPEVMKHGGIPQKSESLVGGLKRLAPLITECEEKFDTRVEF